MREISTGHNLVANTKTLCYKVPAGYYARWNLCYIVNHTGNNKTIDIAWYDASSNAEIMVLDNALLSPSQYIKFDGGAYVVLEAGDIIYATSEADSTMSVINTFELITVKSSSIN